MAAGNAPIAYNDPRQQLATVMTNPMARGSSPGGSFSMPDGGMRTNVFQGAGGGGGFNLPNGGMTTNDMAGSGTGSSTNQPAPGMQVDGNSVDPATGMRYDGSNAGMGGAPGSAQNSADYQVGGVGGYYDQVGMNGSDRAPGVGDYYGQMSPDAMKAASDSAYQQASEYFQPDFARQQSDLENQLASQGFTRGSEGFTRALDDMQRQQDLARTNAALGAQQVGFGQWNQAMQDALATRAQDIGQWGQASQNALAARGQDVTMRGQDKGVDSAGIGASASVGAANIGANSANYRADLDSELGLRQLGLQQNNQDFNQTMTLMGGARGGVNAPNFGAAQPIDVGGAYGIASGNANSQANRDASNRNALYGLGASALGSFVNNYNGGY